MASLVLGAYKDWLRAKGKSRETAMQYGRSVELACQATHKQPQHLSADDIGRFIQSLREKGASDNTIRARVSGLSDFIEYLTGKEIPLGNVELPRQKITKTEKVPITGGHLLSFLGALKSVGVQNPHLTAIRLYTFLPLTVQRVCALEKENIKVRDGKPALALAGRVVKFTPLSAKLLVEYLKTYRRHIGSKWLFPSPRSDGMPIDRKTTQQMIYKALDSVGIEISKVNEIRGIGQVLLNTGEVSTDDLLKATL